VSRLFKKIGVAPRNTAGRLLNGGECRSTVFPSRTATIDHAERRSASHVLPSRKSVGSFADSLIGENDGTRKVPSDRYTTARLLVSLARIRISDGEILTQKPSARAMRRRWLRQLTWSRILTARGATFPSASPVNDENCVPVSRVRPSCYHKTGQLTESRADPQLSGAHARIKVVSA